MTAVEDDVELLSFFHLFEQRFGILGVGGELSDLQADVVSGRSFNELLQADEACGTQQSTTADLNLTAHPTNTALDNLWTHTQPRHFEKEMHVCL